ncbi:MAG: ABC transporter substrate-binding protein [Massiliimalia sp.]|jgi:multiple sugar transport system substrate-binding protein
MTGVKQVLCCLISACLLTGTLGCGLQPEAEKKVVRLEYTCSLTLSDDDPMLRWLQDCAESWKNPDCRIEVVPLYDSAEIFFSQYPLNLFSAYDACPDMIISDTIRREFQRDIKPGWFADLTEYVQEYDDWTNGAYYESLKNSGIVKDKVYGIPCSASINGLWYQKDLLAQAGITQFSPESWEELWEVLRVIDETVPEVIPFASSIVTPLILGGKEKRFLDDPSASQWNQPGELNWETSWEELQLTPYLESFHDGELAVLLSLNMIPDYYGEDALRPWEDFSEKVGFAPFPDESGEGYTTQGNFKYFVILEQCEEKEAAFDFITYCMEPENYNDMIVRTPYLPSRKEAGEQEYYQSSEFRRIQTELLNDMIVPEDNRN